MNDNQSLQNQINELRKEISLLKSNSTIPLNVDNAFQQRGFMKYITVEELDPLSYDSLNTLVPTPSGDFPVLAFPVRWIKLTLTYPGGASYVIPAYTLFNEFT